MIPKIIHTMWIDKHDYDNSLSAQEISRISRIRYELAGESPQIPGMGIYFLEPPTDRKALGTT